MFDAHGYAYDTLGPKSLIATVPRDTIGAYYKAWYKPSQLSTVVVGDISLADALNKVATAFQAQSANNASVLLDSNAIPHQRFRPFNPYQPLR